MISDLDKIWVDLEACNLSRWSLIKLAEDAHQTSYRNLLKPIKEVRQVKWGKFTKGNGPQLTSLTCSPRMHIFWLHLASLTESHQHHHICGFISHPPYDHISNITGDNDVIPADTSNYNVHSVHTLWLYSVKLLPSNEKSTLCREHFLDISTRATPLCSPSSVPSSELKSISLASLLAKLAYLATCMLFILQLDFTVCNGGQLKNK